MTSPNFRVFTSRSPNSMGFEPTLTWRAVLGGLCKARRPAVRGWQPREPYPGRRASLPVACRVHHSLSRVLPVPSEDNIRAAGGKPKRRPRTGRRLAPFGAVARGGSLGPTRGTNCLRAGGPKSGFPQGMEQACRPTSYPELRSPGRLPRSPECHSTLRGAQFVGFRKAIRLQQNPLLLRLRGQNRAEDRSANNNRTCHP